MGIEYAFLPNWSAKIEYNFIDFGTRSFNAALKDSADDGRHPNFIFWACLATKKNPKQSTRLGG